MKKRRTSVETSGIFGGSPLAGLGLRDSPLSLGTRNPGVLAVDGSMSVVRQDDDVSNSGLLDLGPVLPMLRHGSDSRKHGLRTPILGPHDGVQLLQPPPLKEKTKMLPRRSSSLGGWAQTTHGTRNTSDMRSISTGSNDSVIIHDDPPSKWEESPDKNMPESHMTREDQPLQPSLTGRLRRWMHDAMKQHMYETAIFWGRHVVALEST